MTKICIVSFVTVFIWKGFKIFLPRNLMYLFIAWHHHVYRNTFIAFPFL